MATITQLPTCCFLENLPQITIGEVASGTAATVSVMFNGTTLLSEIAMSPDKNGRIDIYARQMIRNMSVLAGPESADTDLPRLTVRSIGGATTETESYIIPGGVGADKEVTPEWFSRNFLSWQPQILEIPPSQPQWLAFIPVPLCLRYSLMSVLHSQDGRTFSKIIRAVAPGYRYVQVDTSFDTLWREFCTEKDISPLSYDVFGAKTVQETAADESTGDKLATYGNYPFAQRYRLRQPRYDDRCFGFVNSLGGFDTLMMQGPETLKPEGETETFVNGEVEQEISNGYTSYWETSSGYIDTERQAAQIRDFLKSASRWIYRDGEWLRIIVDEHKVEHSPGKLNAFSFKYHLARRNEGRYYERTTLPEPEMPTDFWHPKPIF